MKYAVRLMAAVLSWILLLNLVSCAEPDKESPTQPTQPTQPVLSAAEIYDTAKAALLAAPNRVASYTMTKVRTVAGQAYTESAAGTASFSDYGKDTMVAIVDEDIRYGTVKAEHLLSFCNGRAYSRISGSTFGTDITASEFVSRQLPGALLTSSLYESVTRSTNSDGAVITFSQPKALEDWVDTPDGTALVSATGTATFDTTGALVQTTYTAEYTCANVIFSLTATVRCTTPSQLELSALHPEHPEDYATLACLDAPKLLLRAAGDIFTAKVISASAEENIHSQIISVTRHKKSQIEISGVSEGLSARLTNTVSIKDYRDQPTTTTQEYLFSNGTCFLRTDGGEPTAQPGITAETMRTSIEDALLSALFATRYLDGAAILTDEGGVYRLDLVGNEAYCEDLTQALSAFLNLPMDGVTSHHSTQAGGYLCLDPVTGLPVSMGMHFTRTHMFGDIPYLMSYQLDQVMALSPAE